MCCIDCEYFGFLINGYVCIFGSYISSADGADVACLNFSKKEQK